MTLQAAAQRFDYIFNRITTDDGVGLRVNNRLGGDFGEGSGNAGPHIFLS